MSDSNSVYSQESNQDLDKQAKQEKKPQKSQEEIIKQKNAVILLKTLVNITLECKTDI